MEEEFNVAGQMQVYPRAVSSDDSGPVPRACPALFFAWPGCPAAALPAGATWKVQGSLQGLGQ